MRGICNSPEPFREIRGMTQPHGKEEQPGNMGNVIHIDNKV